MSGRPKAVDKVAVLQAIHECKITSPYEIAEKLGCGKSTIYRRMGEISQNEIDEALGLVSEAAASKPVEQKWDVFRRLPEVKKYIETLLYVRKNTATYSMKRVRMLFQSLRSAQEKALSFDTRDGKGAADQDQKGRAQYWRV